MHANFAILEITLIALYITCSALAGLSGLSAWAAFAFLIFYYMLCSVNFHQMINLMKIDVSGYNLAIRRTLTLHLYSVIAFAIIYYLNRNNIIGLTDPIDAAYFSASMWTTLGFEKITPSGPMRIIAVSQAFSGLIHFAIFISMYWFYAQSAMEGASKRAKTNTEPNLRLKKSDDFGFFERVDSENNPITKDANNYNCKPCKKCNSYLLLIREYYNWHHEFVQLPNFVVCCTQCMSVGPSKHHTILAVRAWNRSKPQKRSNNADSSNVKFSDLVVEPDTDSSAWRLAEPLTVEFGSPPRETTPSQDELQNAIDRD